MQSNRIAASIAALIIVGGVGAVAMNRTRSDVSQPDKPLPLGATFPKIAASFPVSGSISGNGDSSFVASDEMGMPVAFTVSGDVKFPEVAAVWSWAPSDAELRKSIQRAMDTFGVAGTPAFDTQGWSVGNSDSGPALLGYAFDASWFQFVDRSAMELCSTPASTEPGSPAGLDGPRPLDAANPTPVGGCNVTPNLPTDETAIASAQRFMKALGVSNAAPVIERTEFAVQVRVNIELDGHQVKDAQFRFTFGADARLLGADGPIGLPTRFGDYPLAPTEALIARLGAFGHPVFDPTVPMPAALISTTVSPQAPGLTTVPPGVATTVVPDPAAVPLENDAVPMATVAASCGEPDPSSCGPAPVDGQPLAPLVPPTTPIGRPEPRVVTITGGSLSWQSYGGPTGRMVVPFADFTASDATVWTVLAVADEMLADPDASMVTTTMPDLGNYASSTIAAPSTTMACPTAPGGAIDCSMLYPSDPPPADGSPRTTVPPPTTLPVCRPDGSSPYPSMPCLPECEPGAVPTDQCIDMTRYRVRGAPSDSSTTTVPIDVPVG
jgi:hypothetical protein